MDQASVEVLSMHIATLDSLLIQRANKQDVYDKLLDRIEALLIDLIRSRLH